MSKEKAIINLIAVFRKYGYEGATLSRLGEATGLGRSSLYHYFPKGKEEMAGAVLEYVSHCFETTILAPLRTNEEPLQRLKEMCEKVNQFYGQGQENCLLNAISLGEGNALFQPLIQQAFSMWIEEIRQVLLIAGIEEEEAYNRAVEAVILIEGSLVLVRGLKNKEPFEKVISNLPDKLLKSTF